ncbi:MAG: RNase adapter RapZ [Deltaproteobacteria bacterium]|nr:RNase adapter RapZ [Deltaproteobacteria bacterium]
MRIVLITGLSGSGKSTALRALEDIGFYAVDNLPIRLLDDLIALFSESDSLNAVEKVALVIDARATRPRSNSGSFAGEIPLIPEALARVRHAGHDLQVVFLDALDEAIERRYSETRRRHPLSIDGTVRSGVVTERRLLATMKEAANRRIDTSGMSVHDLRREIQDTFDQEGSSHELAVTVTSFGFKYGVPTDADLMFDVRFLPNPYFVESLRLSTGESSDVSDYVFAHAETHVFLGKLLDLLTFLLPQYQNEGKAYLTIAIGCTGGRHRSVALAVEVARRLKESGASVRVRHRDVNR